MKIFDIALISFIFCLMLTFVQSPDMGIFDDPPFGEIGWDNSSSVAFKDKVDNFQGEHFIYQAILLPGIVWSITMMFFTLIGQTLTVVPDILTSVGVPELLNWSISSVLYMVYAIGVLQLIIGRTIKFMR